MSGDSKNVSKEDRFPLLDLTNDYNDLILDDDYSNDQSNNSDDGNQISNSATGNNAKNQFENSKVSNQKRKKSTDKFEIQNSGDSGKISDSLVRDDKNMKQEGKFNDYVLDLLCKEENSQSPRKLHSQNDDYVDLSHWNQLSKGIFSYNSDSKYKNNGEEIQPCKNLDESNGFVASQKSDDSYVKIDQNSGNKSDSQLTKENLEDLISALQNLLSVINQEKSDCENGISSEKTTKNKSGDSEQKSIKKLLDGLCDDNKASEKQMCEEIDNKKLVNNSVNLTFDRGTKTHIKRLQKAVDFSKIWSIILTFFLLWLFVFAIIEVRSFFNTTTQTIQNLRQELRTNMTSLSENLIKNQTNDSAKFEVDSTHFENLEQSLKEFSRQLEILQNVQNQTSEQNYMLSSALFNRVNFIQENFHKEIENLGQQFQNLQKSFVNLDNKLENHQKNLKIYEQIKLYREIQEKIQKTEQTQQNKDIFDENLYYQIRVSSLIKYSKNGDLFLLDFEFIDVPTQYFSVVIDQEQTRYINQAIKNRQYGKNGNDVDKNVRPSVFDTWKRTLINNNMRIKRITISSLEGEIYRAEIWTEKLENGEVQIDDSRVSVATNLALRLNAPIFVAKTLV